jgi:hypothetical protein
MKWETTVNVSGGKDAEFGNRYTIQSDFLISGVGQLNLPRGIDVPGQEDYNGKIMHSARWDWSYHLDGKRVAIIGTGMSLLLLLSSTFFTLCTHPLSPIIPAPDKHRRNHRANRPRTRQNHQPSNRHPTLSRLGHPPTRQTHPPVSPHPPQIRSPHPLALPRLRHGHARSLLPRRDPALLPPRPTHASSTRS